MRFFVQAENWLPPEFQLSGEEAHHAHTVLRVREGAKARVFQGEGEEWLAEVTFSSPSQVQLTGIEPITEAPLAAEVLLLQALPKGSKMELIVAKAVELGVSEIWPIASARSVMRLEAKQAEKKREKWQRLALEAAKQCGHPRLPPVHLPQALQSALEKLTQNPPDLLLLTSLQEDAQALLSVLRDQLDVLTQAQNTPKRIAVLIGPEGDFTAQEIELCLHAGAQSVSLGSLVLRTETAALCALSQILAGLEFLS